MPALETRATRHSPSGLVNGVQGIWLGGGSCWIQDRTSLRVGPSTKGWDRTCLASSWQSVGWSTSVLVISASRSASTRVLPARLDLLPHHRGDLPSLLPLAPGAQGRGSCDPGAGCQDVARDHPVTRGL